MDRTLKAACTAIGIALAGPASALSYACSYTTECIDTEGCQDTAYDLTIDVADDYSSAVISSVSGDVESVAYNAQFLSYYAGYASNTMHVVSVYMRGESRYSVQTPAGEAMMAITYLGRCEQTQ